MAELIRELDRFKKDCEKYERIIVKLTEINAGKAKSIETIYKDFLLKVEAVDKSVEDMVSGFVAVGLQHGTYVEELKKVRLKLDHEISQAEKILIKHESS